MTPTAAPASALPSIMLTLVSIAVAVAVLLGPLAAMTAHGAQRRGNGAWIAALSGLFFPVTWVVWYLRDEHPYAQS